MSADLRLRHDRLLREQAVEMFERGRGYALTARRLGVSAETVREWQKMYRVIGRDGLLAMGVKQARYDYETKVAAARAVVDGGMSKPEAMVRFGIASATPLKQWCRLYREGGAQALKPKPKGRLKGSGVGAVPPTREEELEERVRKLEAQVAYLKKIDCAEGAEALPNRDKALVVAELSGRGHKVRDLLEAAGLSRSSYYYALAHPQQPTRAQLRPKVAQIFSRTPNGCGHRQVAMCLRAEDGERIADKTVLKMMREMGLRCGICRERAYHRYNSYKGDVGQSFDNIIGRDFKATGPWQKLGTDVTEFKLSFGKAYLAPVCDFASKEIVAHSISMCPNLAQQQEMLQILMEAKPAGAEPILHSDMGWQYQHKAYIRTLADNGFIQSMSRKGNCIDNGATEQVFGHLKDEFFRGRDWQTFESFKADLATYITHWNTTRRQVKLKGLTPAEYRDQALREAA